MDSFGLVLETPMIGPTTVPVEPKPVFVLEPVVLPNAPAAVPVPVVLVPSLEVVGPEELEVIGLEELEVIELEELGLPAKGLVPNELIPVVGPFCVPPMGVPTGLPTGVVPGGWNGNG